MAVGVGLCPCTIANKLFVPLWGPSKSPVLCTGLFTDLRFWKGDLHIEIPLEVTQIVCLDPPTIRTASGTVHPTPSDADLIESKVIAVLTGYSSSIVIWWISFFTETNCARIRPPG